MKKVAVVFFIFFVITLYSLNTNFFDYLSTLESDAEISFYCTEKQNGFESMHEIKNGEGYIYTTKLNDEKNITEIKNNCYGFSIKFNKNNCFDEILSKINIFFEEKIENEIIFCGIVDGIYFSNYIKSQKINIQIAKCEDYFVVGCPIIFGSY